MIILYAIPVFMLLIAVEAIYDQRTKSRYYRFNDAVAALSTGMLNRTLNFAVLYLNWAAYSTLFSYFNYFSLPESVLTWLIAFIVYDFFYYWSHRIDHIYSLFWNAHAVHHHSEEFNLTTALRQPFSGFIKGSIVFFPMVFLGFDPLTVATVGSLNLVYQFWVHTRYINRLGWLEYVLVTPSNHRVHHGMNDKYIDKNFGGVFIVWDRLFKTFEDEDPNEPVVFGVRKQLNSFNPFYSNVQIIWLMLKDIWLVKDFRIAFKILTSRTGIRPDELDVIDPKQRLDLNSYTIYNPRALRNAQFLIWPQLLFSLGYTLWFLLSVPESDFLDSLVHFIPLGLVLLSMNWILEGRVIGLFTEAIRLFYMAVVFQFNYNHWPELVAVAYIGFSSIWFVLWLSQNAVKRPAAIEE